MPDTLADLQKKLLALNTPEQPYVVTVQGNQVVATWNMVDAKWLKIFGESGMKKSYRMTLTLDEATHTANSVDEESEVTWSAGVPTMSAGFHRFKGNIIEKKEFGVAYGVKPDLSVGQLYKFDFDISKIKGPVKQVVADSGWNFKQSGGMGGSISVIIGIVLLFFVLILGIIFYVIKSGSGSYSYTINGQTYSSGMPDYTPSSSPSDFTIN